MACMGGRRGVYRVWWRGLRERDHLEGLVVKDIKMGLKELGLGGMDWIELERTGQLPRKDSAPWSYQ